MNDLVCGFIGLGLIGGSIAKALKKHLPQVKIIAYDINADSLKQAYEEKTADTVTSHIDSSFSCCDYIFLCAPITDNDSSLKKLIPFLSKDCILTDVGSVKTGIHKQIEALGLSQRFIGGHPMAGSERTGYLNSKAILLENAYYILTPTDTVSDDKITAYQELVRQMGAIPLVLSYEQHDYVTAAVSHLPHVISASLVNLVKDSDSKDGIMKMIAAGGFKDITRISSSSPYMWQQISLSNGHNISELLGNYIDSLQKIKEEIDTKNSGELYELFDNARTYRDSFIDASSGPIKRSFSIKVDIPDEPGALASIATMLALRSISIKNIGIVHNRELEEGVLRIEFHEEASIETAKQILSAKGYTVHEK